MKITIISKTICAFAFMLSLTSLASEKKEDHENKTTAKSTGLNASLFKLSHTNKLKLAVDKGTDSRLRVVLKDKGGRVLYSETYSKSDEQYRRVFDLDGMNDGQYYFELGYGDQKIVKEIEIQTNKERVISLQ